MLHDAFEVVRRRKLDPAVVQQHIDRRDDAAHPDRCKCELSRTVDASFAVIPVVDVVAANPHVIGLDVDHGWHQLLVASLDREPALDVDVATATRWKRGLVCGDAIIEERRILHRVEHRDCLRLRWVHRDVLEYEPGVIGVLEEARLDGCGTGIRLEHGGNERLARRQPVGDQSVEVDRRTRNVQEAGQVVVGVPEQRLDRHDVVGCEQWCGRRRTSERNLDSGRR